MDAINNKKNIIGSAIFCDGEILFYLVLMINYGYLVSFSVYQTFHDYYTLTVFGFSILMMVFWGRNLITGGFIIFSVAQVILLIMAISVNHGGFGLLIEFLWPLSLYAFLANIRDSETFIRRFKTIVFIGWVLGLVKSIGYTRDYINSYEPNNTLGINPNGVAYIIAVSALFLLLKTNDKDNRTKAIVMMGLASLIGIYKAGSRNVLISYVCALVLAFLINKNVIKRKGYHLTIIVGTIIIGVLFPIIYTLIYEKGIIPESTKILGKRLFTGRQTIWSGFFDYMRVHPTEWIWGSGPRDFWIYGFNLHNGYLQIIAQFGMIEVLTLGVGFVLWITNNLKRRSINYNGTICLALMLFFLINAIGDANLTYLPYLGFIGITFGLFHNLGGQIIDI